MTLDEIVTSYIQDYRAPGQAEVRFFRSLASFTEVIGNAVRPGGHKHSHQYLIPRISLDEAERRLQSAAPELTQAADFACLHDVVVHAAGSIRGIGALAVYDIAHRIGMHLGKSPEFVYLHRGAKDGAAILGLRGKTLNPKLLPPAFSRLTAAEIEDCLCIYKHELASGTPSARPLATAHRCLSARQHVPSRC
jgi:hypothetical protein